MDETVLAGAAPQGILRRIFEKIPRYILITFTAAFALCLIVHHQAYCKMLLNHDNVGAMFGTNYGALSGRWLLPAAMAMDGSSFSLSWIIGLISALLLSLSACLAVSVMRIRSTVGCIAASAIMVTFPSVASNNFYMFSADAYMMSLFLACLGAYLAVKRKKPIWSVLGGILIALSASIYQAYVCVAAAMLVGALVFDLLDGESVSAVLKNALKYLAALIVGIAAYYIAAQITAPAGGLVDYMGLADMGIHFEQLPEMIGCAYSYYIDYYILDIFNLHSALATAAFCAMVIAAAGVGAFIVRRRGLNRGQVLLLAILAVILPMAANLTIVMAAVPVEKVHTLMIFGLCMVPVAAVGVGDYAYSITGEKGSKAGRIAATFFVWLIMCGALVLSVNYALRDNEAYFKSEIVEQQSVSFGNRLLAAVQQTEGYEAGMATVIVGNTGVYYDDTPELDDVGVTGSFSMSGIIRSYDYDLFLQRYCGWTDTIYVDEVEIAHEYAAMDEVIEMPVYPNEGSVKVIGDVVVVKMS